jgi:hypothetical protein
LNELLILRNVQVQQKRLGELGKGPRIGELDQWLAELFVSAARYADTFPYAPQCIPVDWLV